MKACKSRSSAEVREDYPAHGSCTTIHKKTKLSESALCGIQCNMLTVELEFINPFAVTSFRAQVVINEESHSPKGTDGSEFRRYHRKKADNSSPFVFCLFTSKQGTAIAQCILVALVATQCILVPAQCIATKSWSCIDFLYTQIKTAVLSLRSLRCN